MPQSGDGSTEVYIYKHLLSYTLKISALYFIICVIHIITSKQKNLYILSRVGRLSCRIFLNRIQHIPRKFNGLLLFSENFSIMYTRHSIYVIKWSIWITAILVNLLYYYRDLTKYQILKYVILDKFSSLLFKNWHFYIFLYVCIFNEYCQETNWVLKGPEAVHVPQYLD